MPRPFARHLLALLAALGVAGLALALGARPRPRPPLPRLAPEGALAYDIRDADTGELIPGKLTLVGLKGTPDPDFSHGDIGRPSGGAVLAFNRIMSLSGTGVHHVPVGTYEVHVSRGPEWTDFVVPRLAVGAGTAEVRAELRHVVDTTGWISGDFHVHAAPSSDSRVPMAHRVFEFAADGVELIVSTDHNVVADYGPDIRELGAGRFLASLIGDEITPARWGHFGAWPLPQELVGLGHNAVHVRTGSAANLFRGVREQSPETIISVHHPRLDPQIGYFTYGNFDGANDAAVRPGFSFDFDAIEVLNGYQDPVRRSFDRTIADWYGLLDHGHLVTAMGNSDTHHLTYNLGGYPRNYVYVGLDDPAQVTPAAVARAVRERHVVISTGPFVRVRVGAGRIGDVVRAPGGRARVEVEVEAAPWIDVTSATLILNGKEERRWEVPRGTDPVRLRRNHDVQVSRDSWLVVRVDGKKTLTPVVGDGKRFVVYPFALTNPIFLDVDGNGRFDPPHGHGAHAPAEGKPKAAPGAAPAGPPRR